jgi:hypothetical protein
MLANALFILGLLSAGYALIYLILPRLGLGLKKNLAIKSVLFFAIIGYLAWDFWQKGKQTWIIFLLMGSAAFVKIIIDINREDHNKKGPGEGP